MGKQDNIFEGGNLSGLAFTFNQEVTEVFEDMIDRSVPGYRTSLNIIQQQTKQLAGRVSRGCYEVPAPISGRLVFMDRLFNRVLIKHPELSVNLFMQMAGALNGEQFARFMTGTASFSEWGKVILSMPKIPFLRHMWSV